MKMEDLANILFSDALSGDVTRDEFVQELIDHCEELCVDSFESGYNTAMCMNRNM